MAAPAFLLLFPMDIRVAGLRKTESRQILRESGAEQPGKCRNLVKNTAAVGIFDGSNKKIKFFSKSP